MLENSLIVCDFGRKMKIFLCISKGFHLKINVWSRVVTACGKITNIGKPQPLILLCGALKSRRGGIKEVWPYFPMSSFFIETYITLTLFFCKYFESAWSISVTCPTPRSAWQHRNMNFWIGFRSRVTDNWIYKWLIYFDVNLINAAYETPNVTIQFYNFNY